MLVVHALRLITDVLHARRQLLHECDVHKHERFIWDTESLSDQQACVSE